MPAPEQILGGLAEITNQWRTLAIVWHVYFGALALGLILGARPSKRMAGILLGLPMFSVSVLAWAAADPFNGAFFSLAGITLIVVSSRLPGERIETAPTWVVIAGAFMFVFGWLYPHFLDAPSWVPYLYSAPTGLIPCPTLSIVTGTTLILIGLGSRTWSLVLAATGISYGVFGAARLGVMIDWVLVLGSLLLAFIALRPSIGMHTVKNEQWMG